MNSLEETRARDALVEDRAELPAALRALLHPPERTRADVTTSEATAPVAVARVAQRYDAASMAMHWVSAILVVALFTTAWTRGWASSASAALLILQVHRSAGALLWLWTIGRLAWKLTRARQPALPGDLPGWQRLAARTHEWLLYGLLVLQPVSGLALTLVIGKAFMLFGLRVPALAERDPAWIPRLGLLHEACGIALAAFAALHVLAALYHHVVRRDDVLRTMLPGPRRAG